MRRFPTLALTAAALAAALLAAAGCGDGAPRIAWRTLEPGLDYADSTTGSGRAAAVGDYVQVYLANWVWQDGARSGPELFDEKYWKDQPVVFAVGRNMVNEGFDKGVVGMQEGGIRFLRVGPALAYGERGMPGLVPPDATLFYKVRLAGFPQIEKEILAQGDGPAAAIGDQIAVEYTGWLWENGRKGEQVDSSFDRGLPLRLTLGEGMVIAGWEMGLTGMRVGTKARLIIPPLLGYGRDGSPPSIPPNATLCYEVELMEILDK